MDNRSFVHPAGSLRSRDRSAAELAACTQVLRSQMASAAVTRTAAALLRQLAGSDAIKAELAEGDVFPLVTGAVRLHGEAGHLAACEQLLGLLAALTLRNPEAGPPALDSGCLAAALQVCLPPVWLLSQMHGDCAVHSQAGHLAACEQLLGLLAALTLRNPEAGPPALEAGCMAAALHMHGLCKCVISGRLGVGPCRCGDGSLQLGCAEWCLPGC